MTINLTIPKLGPKNQSTKDLIISLLTYEWPLTTKEIYFKIQKNSSDSLSYQAVHKTIQQLIDENVIIVENKKYQLNSRWIEELKNYTNTLDNVYSSSNNKYKLSPDFSGTIKLVFDDLTIVPVRLAEIFASKALVGSGPDMIVAMFRHVLWPLRFNFRDFDLLKRMCNNNPNAWCVVKEKSPFDMWITKQYKLAGMSNVKICPELEEYDIIAQGETVFQLKFSKEANEFMDEIYSRVNNLQNLFKEYISQKNEKKQAKIELTVTKNPQLASIIRKQTISYFKEVAK